MKMKLVLLLGIASLMSACAGMGTKFEKEKLKNVKTVAIVAVDVQQKRATDNLGLGKLTNSVTDVPDSDSTEMQAMVTKVTENLASQLQRKTNWKVIAQKDVIANTFYKKKVDEKMSGMRFSTPLAETHDIIIPKGMFDPTNFATLKTEDRAQLAKALGVDALVEISVVNSMEQSMFSLGHAFGGGDYALKAQARVQVFSPSSEDPIWRSQYVSGEETENSSVLPKSMSKRQKMSTLGEKASSSATQKVVDTYTR